MPTQKEIKAAIMDVLKRDVDRGNNGVLSQYRTSAESTRLLREEHISISGNSVLKDGEPLYRIRRRYSPHMVNGMYRELVPQLEAAEPSMEPERQRLYVDMDGTLTVFTPVDTNEQLYQEGFFRDAQAHENVVEAVKDIVQNHPEIEVYVLSAYLTDSEYALQEKNAWLDEHIPEIDPAHRIFVPNGSDKKEYVEGGLRNNDFLLDDYTKNLSQWEPPARGIKLLNAINHTRGTWEHDRIRYDRTPADLANGIVGIMRNEERVYDARVERNVPHEFTVHKSVLDGAWGGGLTQKYEALDEDGVVAGTLDFQTDRYGKPYVLYVETEQEYRRQGVATLLMQELQRDVFPQEIDFGLTTPEGTALLNAITEERENPEGRAEREELETLRNLLSETQNRLDNLYQSEELDGITPETEAEIADLGDRWQDTSYRIRQLEDVLDEYGQESYRYVTLPEWKEEKERPHGEESRMETLVREYRSLDGFSNDAIETEIDARDDTAVGGIRDQDLERYGTKFLHAAMLVRENGLEDLQEFRDSLGGTGLTPWNMRHFNADRNILDLAIELSQGIQQNERRREMPTLDEYPLETLGVIAHIDDPEHINNNIAMSFYEGYSRTQGNPAISDGAEFFRRFQDGWSRANLKNAGRTGFYVFQRDLFDTGEYELVHVNTRNPVPDRDGMYSFGNGEALTDRQAAERIYQQLNTQAHPVDYYGTSPSVGDLIVFAESTLRPGEVAFSADDFRVMKVDRFGFSRANEELTPQMIAKMRNEMDVRQEIQLREELAHFAAEVGVDLPSERLSVLHREFDDPIRMSQQRLLDGVIERYDNDSRNFENGLIAVYQNPDMPGSADGIENVADDDFHVIFGIGDPYTPISGGHFSTLQEAQENVMRLRPAAQQIYERPVLFMPDDPGLQNYLDSHPGYKSIQFSDSVISQSNLTNMVYVYRDAMDFRIPSIIREAREQERTLESLQHPSEGTGEYIYRVEANPRPTQGENDSFYIQAYRPLENGQMEIGNVLYIGTFERCRELAEQLRVGKIQPEQLRDSYLRSLDVYRAEDFTLSDVRGIGTNGRGEPIAAIEFETVDGQRGMFHYNVQDTIRASFFDRENGETADLKGIMRSEEEFVSLSARIEGRALSEAVREGISEADSFDKIVGIEGDINRYADRLLSSYPVMPEEFNEEILRMELSEKAAALLMEEYRTAGGMREINTADRNFDSLRTGLLSTDDVNLVNMVRTEEQGRVLQSAGRIGIYRSSDIDLSGISGIGETGVGRFETSDGRTGTLRYSREGDISVTFPTSPAGSIDRTYSLSEIMADENEVSAVKGRVEGQYLYERIYTDIADISDLDLYDNAGEILGVESRITNNENRLKDEYTDMPVTYDVDSLRRSLSRRTANALVNHLRNPQTIEEYEAAYGTFRVLMGETVNVLNMADERRVREAVEERQEQIAQEAGDNARQEENEGGVAYAEETTEQYTPISGEWQNGNIPVAIESTEDYETEGFRADRGITDIDTQNPDGTWGREYAHERYRFVTYDLMSGRVHPLDARVFLNDRDIAVRDLEIAVRENPRYVPLDYEALINRAADRAVLFRDTIRQAMEVAGYTVDPYSDTLTFYHEDGTGRMQFDDYVEAFEWLDGVVLDDLPAESQNRIGELVGSLKETAVEEGRMENTMPEMDNGQYEPTPNRYTSLSDERLGDLSGTAEELFVMARNGYVENVEQLEAIRDVLNNPVEQRADEARLVGFIIEREQNEQNPDIDTSAYNVGALKADFEQGINGGLDDVEIDEGMNLSLWRDGDNVIMSLHSFQEQEDGSILEGTGATSIPLDEFNAMSQQDFDVRMGTLYSMGMEFTEQEPEREQEQERMDYVVVTQSGGVRNDMATFPTMEEAEQFMEYMGYEYRDENGFVWDMDVDTRPHEPTADILEEFSYGARDFGEGRIFRIYERGELPESDYPNQFWAVVEGGDLPGGRYEFEYDHHPTHDEVYGDFMDRYSAAALDLSEAALDRAEQENPLVENVPVVVERYVSTMNMQDGYEEPIAILREGNGSYSVQYNFDEDTGKGASATGQFATLEEARQDLLAHRTDAREEGREPGRMVVQAASMSCIPGYVVMSQFGRDDISPSENVILGKAENYNNRGVYDNSDYSAIPVSENGKMHSFLSASAGWTVSQQHFLDNGTFTAADYTEYARLREELSARFPDFQTKMFEIDIDREGSGVPFNPDWQNPNRERQEQAYTAESVTDIVGKDSSYDRGSRETTTTFDCKINGEPATLTFTQGQTETFTTPLSDRGDISDTYSIHTDGSVDLWDALDSGELDKLADRLVEEKDYFQLTRRANDAKTIEEVNDAAYAYTESESIRLTDEHKNALFSTIENKAISISREMVANATPENINDVATQIKDWISGFAISDENREMLLKEAQARGEEMEKENTRDTQAALPHGEDEEKLSAKDKLSQDLNEGVQKALNSENFKSWLDTSSKMFTNNYSFRNAILIWAQKPEASYCMGFEAWKDYGRTVAKGATAAKIFVPVIAYEKNEGGLFNMIKGNLTNQLKNDPTKPAVYRVGLSKIEITMNQQGLFGLCLNGKEQGIMNEQQMKRFIQNSVLNKVPMYFTTGNVFDVKDTAIPQFLWLKKGFTKDEIAKDENGKPIKNKKGEYKIINTPERQAKFNVNLEGEVKAQDPKKMAILLDALKSVSDRNGVPVTEKDKQDDEVLRGDAKGYFNRETNAITLDKNLEPTEKCAILLHEMGHADLHGDLEKLAREMGEKVPRSMREVQAEGVAYMTGRQMGLETNTASFSYIAAWSKGFEAQDLQKSLEVIYNESRKLMKEISAELDVRGLNLDLSEKPKEPLMQETKKELAAGYITRALAVESRNTDILTCVNETGAQYKNRMDVIAVLAQQQQLAQNQIGEAGNVKQLCESLMKSTDRTEQDGILAQLEAAKGRMDIGENRQNQLEQMFIGACAEKGANRRDEFVKNPETVIAQLREAFPEKMAAIGAMQASYVCNSKYIRDNTARLLNTDKTGEKFVDEICNRAAAVDKVAAKNGCFVEVNFCEQWTDKPIVESGALCHPNVFNDIIKQGEVQIQKLKREAEKTGDYFPYNKCDISVFHPDKTSDVPKLTGTVQRIDIGDGGQKSFGDFIHQMAGEKSELSQVVDSAIRERGAKEKIVFNKLAAAEPKAQETGKNQPEQEAPEQTEDKTKSLEEWKKEIKDERGNGGNGHEAQKQTQDKAKGSKSHDRADG